MPHCVADEDEETGAFRGEAGQAIPAAWRIHLVPSMSRASPMTLTVPVVIIAHMDGSAPCP